MAAESWQSPMAHAVLAKGVDPPPTWMRCFSSMAALPKSRHQRRFSIVRITRLRHLEFL
jgi:hypothetical protein